MLLALLAVLLIQPSRSDCDGCTISSAQLPFMCIDLTGGSATVGTLLQVWHCNGLKNQEWSWVGGALRFKADTTKCVAVQNGALSVGSKLIVDTCNGQASQQFGMDTSGRIFVGGAQKYCLSPVGDKVDPGTNLQLFVCTYYREQQWACASGMGPPPVPAPDFKKAVTIISESAPSKCLDVPGGKATAGAFLDIWDCVGVAGQQFVFNSDQTVSSMVDKTMCLELTSGIKQEANLQLAKCNANGKQKFGYDSKMATMSSTGTTANSALCMDIPGGKADNGVKLWVWGCNGLPQQQWYVTSGPSDAQGRASEVQKELPQQRQQWHMPSNDAKVVV